MKKYNLLVLFVSLLLLPILNVKAATITSAKYEDSAFKIDGTGTGTVQIVVFDKNNNPLYMTTAVTENGTFSKTLPEIEDLSNGTYNVKVANYDGTESDTEEVVVKLSIKDIATNPKTYDGILPYIEIAGISLLALVGLGLYIKKVKSI